nr:MAG TPA: hypothetical protein [Bacteriophage sp.]
MSYEIRGNGARNNPAPKPLHNGGGARSNPTPRPAPTPNTGKKK